MEQNKTVDMAAQGAVDARNGQTLDMKRETLYVIEAHDKNGNLLWTETFHNLVTTAGLNDSLTKHFKGSGYTAAWYVGLTAATPTFNAADTAASHGGWTENTTYSESVRQTLTLGTASAGSIDNSASKAVFSINGSTTVGGAFVISDSTKSGTSGTLYGGGAFSGGNRSLQSGDTLSITITLTAS